MSNTDLVTVSGLILLAESDKAIGVALFDPEGCAQPPVEFWIPKSQIDRQTMTKKGSIGEVDIPRWLAEKHDMDYQE